MNVEITQDERIKRKRYLYKLFNECVDNYNGIHFTVFYSSLGVDYKEHIWGRGLVHVNEIIEHLITYPPLWTKLNRALRGMDD